MIIHICPLKSANFHLKMCSHRAAMRAALSSFLKIDLGGCLKSCMEVLLSVVPIQ